MGMVGHRIAKRMMIGLMVGLLPWSASAQVLQRSEVVRESEQHIKAVLEEEGMGLRLDRLVYREELKLPDGKVSWKVTAGQNDWRAGRQTIPVEVSVNGKMVTVIQVTATLKQTSRYLVLKRPLKRGDVVSEADLKWEEGELDRPPVDLVDNPRQLAGQSATRQIPAGRPLQYEAFASPHVVARGERVQVAAIRGSLHIETVGIAKAPGRIGETIQLENPASHRRFDARVTGPGRAEVVAW
ncbi:MAG: flagellar basal body P-ring formation protein FlgA [Magnetococcales bacterium]|nr:flagellar basal body P-ring formation protein FlgA [Magnetococcales bacterium]